jgi:hypothetical protein
MSHPPAMPPEPTPGKQSNKILLIVLASIAGFLILCCGGLGLIAALSGQTKPAASASPSVIAEAASGSPSIESTPSEAGESPGPSAVPSSKPSLKPSPKPSPRRVVAPAPKPAPTHTTRPSAQPTRPAPGPIHGVHPGAFCSQHWQYGYTTAGTLMRCTTTASDSRYRWRKA